MTRLLLSQTQLGLSRTDQAGDQPAEGAEDLVTDQPDVGAFAREAKRLLEEVDAECRWMYETLHIDGKTKGCIDYMVWSEVFFCPECAGEVVFLKEALDADTKRVKSDFPCPHCQASLTKAKMERVLETYYDAPLHATSSQPKREPVLVVYRHDSDKKEKEIDEHDAEVIRQIAQLPFPQNFPISEYPYEDMWEAPRMKSRGISHVHHLFLPRAARVMAAIWSRVTKTRDHRLRLFLAYFAEQAIWGMSVLARYAPTHFSQVNQYLAGVYYVPSQHSECSPWYILNGKAKRLTKVFSSRFSRHQQAVTGTSSSAHILARTDSLDYIFIDPPFGDNFAYAELNFLVESWHKVLTQIDCDTIVDRSKKHRHKQKTLHDYRRLMRSCFQELYRVLKPGRWMTIEFSNTKASVWNAIQTALTEAGFIVANVSALDKKQGSFKAVTTPTAVKQDLVISAYKPNDGFGDRFVSEAATEEGVWDFVRTHLKYLPVTKKQGSQLVAIQERDPRILFDQVVGYYVRNGYMLPISSRDFQRGLAQRFDERDGMYFLDEQVAEYDKAKSRAGTVNQLADAMFIKDEATAIAWLRARLKQKPQSTQDIHPQFLQEIGGWSKNETPLELSTLLEQNFLCFDGKSKVPDQIHGYMSSNWKEMRNLAKDDPTLIAKAKNRWYVPDSNKAGDLEKLRERALLKEFDDYRQRTKKFKSNETFRMEAVRAGFKEAWQDRDYQTIIAVAKLIPENILQEDSKLLMWYDQALTRSGEDA